MPRNLMNYQRGHACWRVDTILSHMPPAYQAFWKEWRIEQPKPVHYIPEPGNWKKNLKTGQIERVENVPIQLSFPRQSMLGLWGGEAVIKGYENRGPRARFIPHWWVPSLHRTVLYSEVLDRRLEVVVTQRALQLVHDHYGLDNYLLQSRACDIGSALGLKIKREILLALARGTLRPDDPTRRQQLLDKYGQYILPEEEALWYGLTLGQAVRQRREMRDAAGPPPPLKLQLRAELLQKLRQLHQEQLQSDTKDSLSTSAAASWLSKINPFAEKPGEKR